MNRIVIGACAALLFAAAGLFWWQGRAEVERGAPPPGLAANDAQQPLDALPDANGQGLRGAALPEVSEATREERRFNRLDHNRDGRITRNEMLAPRASAFRKLDVDRNNLLSFEEWAVRTGNRFRGADSNGDGVLTRLEFVATRPKRSARPACRCSPAPKARGRAAAAPAPADSSDGDEGEPAD
ncbi:MAG: hypothetical protein AB7F98_10615 [Novosphingobium sp.]